jgi:hypothetical protein
LERIDTQQHQLAGRDSAITAEQERRRDLTPEQAAAEISQRDQTAEKDTTGPRAKERNNRAMMLARQREQAEQQNQRGRDIER